MRKSEWHAVLDREVLEPGTMRTWKGEGVQLAVGSTDGDIIWKTSKSQIAFTLRMS